MSQKMGIDDFLAHYGVKGMRWGVRKDKEKTWQQEDRELRKKLKDQKFTKDEILTARANQKVRAAAYQREVDKSKRDPETGLLLYTDAVHKVATDWSKSPDRYTANRKTAGEKFVATLLAGPVGAYKFSDRQTTARLAEEAPVKYKRKSKYPYATSPEDY